jgi:hypothetical protein
MQPSKSKGIRVGFDAKFLDSWLRRQKYVWILELQYSWPVSAVFSGEDRSPGIK